MPVERTTPQLVKKGKGKKRPGYRGPGGYQGGRSSGSRGRGPSGPPGGGATSMGSGRDFSRGPSSTNREKGIMSRGKGPKGTTGNIRDFRDTGPDRSAVSQFSTYGRNLMNQNLTKDNPARRRGLGGLGSLIMSGLGMLLGIPGLGLITGGFSKLKEGLGSLNDKIQSTDFARSTSLMDYLDAKKYGGIDARDRAASKNMREARAIQTQMGLRPSSTMSSRDYAMAGLQTPSDPFAMSIGPQAVNVPAREDPVSSYGLQDYGYDYGTAGAAVPTDMLAPTPVETFRDNFYTGIQENFGKPISNFLNTGMDADTVAALENKAVRDYGLDSAAGPVSDFRHMAALNELSKTLSPMDNRVGEFIGDTLAFGGGLINEIPALFRGLNPQNLGEIKEDIIANYKGTYGTPQTMQPIDIYNQVFGNQQMASTGFAEGGIASLSNRRG